MKVTLSLANPSTKTFDVSGKGLEEVFNALQKRAWWGHYEPNLTYAAKSKNAVYTELTVIAKPVISLPKWKELSKQDPKAKKTWDDMLTALSKHENKHHGILEEAAKALKKAMEAGEDLAKKELDKTWGEFDKDLGKKQKAYDDKTGHGKKEGVMLTW